MAWMQALGTDEDWEQDIVGTPGYTQVVDVHQVSCAPEPSSGPWSRNDFSACRHAHLAASVVRRTGVGLARQFSAHFAEFIWTTAISTP